MAERRRESGPYGRFLDAALAALAADQHAVLGLRQLRALGFTARVVQKRAAAGRLHRVHRGVYSLVPPELLTREGRWMAAVLACGPDAVLSHRSAAALHSLRRSGGTSVEVTVKGVSERRHDGVAVHRSSTLTTEDFARVRGIPCTTVSRTLLDLADVLDRRALERAFDQAEIMEAFDLRALNNQLVRNRQRQGGRVIRRILNEHYVGSTPTWSELEERFLELVRAAAIPEPEVNAWVDPNDGEPPMRVDFLWPAQRLVVETDGHATHRTRQAFEHDRRRDQRLMAAGYRVLRVTWRQILLEPRRIQAMVRRLLSC